MSASDAPKRASSAQRRTFTECRFQLRLSRMCRAVTALCRLLSHDFFNATKGFFDCSSCTTKN